MCTPRSYLIKIIEVSNAWKAQNLIKITAQLVHFDYTVNLPHKEETGKESHRTYNKRKQIHTCVILARKKK